MSMVSIFCRVALVGSVLAIVGPVAARDSDVGVPSKNVKTYSPYEYTETTLTNPEGKTIKCELVDFNYEKDHVKIRPSGDWRLMWIDLSILDSDSQTKVRDWQMQKAIYDYISISGERSNDSGSGTRPKYDITIKNSGPVALRNVDVTYRVFKEKAFHGGRGDFSHYGREEEKRMAVGLDEWTFIGEKKRFDEIPTDRRTISFKTKHIEINKTKSKTSFYTQTYDPFTGEDTGPRIKTGSKVESVRDDLKGIQVQVFYKDVLLKEWYSDEVLEKLLNDDER